jgi:riboflavin synthase
MFTGIIEELGRITVMEPVSGGVRLYLDAETVSEDLKIGDSIAVNGACLTVVRLQEREFAVEAVGETLQKTSIGKLNVGDRINLERSMAANDRFGGHFVQGHVNATATISQWYPRGENWYLEIEIPRELMRYIVLEGSIAVEGISLTVASLTDNCIGINIIPHTVKVTNLQFKNSGDPVNIEVDMIAKYIENLLNYKGNPSPGVW